MAIDGVQIINNGIGIDSYNGQKYAYLDVDMHWSDVDISGNAIICGTFAKVNKFVKMMYHPRYGSASGTGAKLNEIPLEIGRWSYFFKPQNWLDAPWYTTCTYIRKNSNGTIYFEFYGFTAAARDFLETQVKIVAQTDTGNFGTINVRIPIVTNGRLRPASSTLNRFIMEDVSANDVILQQPFILLQQTSRTSFALNYSKGWNLYYRLPITQTSGDGPKEVGSSGPWAVGTAWFGDVIGSDFDEIAWAKRTIKTNYDTQYYNNPFWINIPNQYVTYRLLTFGAGVDNSAFGFSPNYPIYTIGTPQNLYWIYGPDYDTPQAFTRFMVLYNVTTVSGPEGSGLDFKQLICDTLPPICSENWDAEIDASWKNECVYYINDDGSIDEFIWGSGYRQIPVKTLEYDNVNAIMQILPTYATSWVI